MAAHAWKGAFAWTWATASAATLAQWLIFMGTVKAGAGTVAPMTYGQLLMAVALGLLFFGERPDLTALAGAAVIVGAGLFLWWRGRAHDRAAAKTDPIT